MFKKLDPLCFVELKVDCKSFRERYTSFDENNQFKRTTINLIVVDIENYWSKNKKNFIILKRAVKLELAF